MKFKNFLETKSSTEFQVRVGKTGLTWHDHVDLRVPTLDQVASELEDREYTGKELVAALPELVHLVLVHHLGESFEKDPDYLDFELDFDLVSHQHDVVKARYRGCGNFKPHSGQTHVQRREFEGELSIMPQN